MTETFRQQQDRLFRDRVERQREIDRDAAEYERQQADRRELARIEEQRAELEEHLRERGTRYVDATGAQPTEATLARWRDEWADNREREHRAEAEERIERAAANDDVF